MNDFPAKLQARAARKSAKRDEKKRQIAASALDALKELGYAHTSLRDIAEKSDMSLGMLHYYFEDRSDLIIYCVMVYKQEFVRTVIRALKAARGRDEVIEAFSEVLVNSIIEDEMTHRLWYDIRNQAMFDDTFRPVVSEIEVMLIDTVGAAFDQAGRKIPPAQVAIQYALVDGVFRYLMQDQFGDRPRSRRALQAIFRDLLGQLL